MVDVGDGGTGVRVTPETDPGIDHSSDEAQLRENPGVVAEWDFGGVLMRRWPLREDWCVFASPGCCTGSCNNTSGRQSQPGFTAH